MNIFFLHTDPCEAAILQADVHVVKMILETLQMICTALRLSYSPFIWPFELYKATHVNHPSTKWVRYSQSNYLWAMQHGIALCHEYTKRYGKIHKCQYYYESLQRMPAPFFPTITLDSFDATKISFHSIPNTSSFIPIAIADDIFDECSRFDNKNNLLAIETYKAYYFHKMKTLKRKMKWYKCEEYPQTLDVEAVVETKKTRSKI